jgi:hypothetical protein
MSQQHYQQMMQQNFPAQHMAMMQHNFPGAAPPQQLQMQQNFPGGAPPQQLQMQPAATLAQKHHENVVKLCKLGFEESLARKGLATACQDVELAATLLLSGKVQGQQASETAVIKAMMRTQGITKKQAKAQLMQLKMQPPLHPPPTGQNLAAPYHVQWQHPGAMTPGAMHMGQPAAMARLGPAGVQPAADTTNRGYGRVPPENGHASLDMPSVFSQGLNMNWYSALADALSDSTQRKSLCADKHNVLLLRHMKVLECSLLIA